MTSFVHLRLHSEYSIVDGLVRLKPLMGRVAELGMPAVAVTDFTNFYGLVKAYKAAFGAGVQPIFGTDLRVMEADDPEKSYPMCLLAMNEAGYKNLTLLISQAYTDGQYLGEPYVRKAWLEECAEGVIALSAGAAGDVGHALLSDKPELARERAEYWMNLYPGRYYLELHRTGREGDETHLHRAVALAGELECPVVATNDVRFLEASEFEAHEARVCIGEGRALDDPRRVRAYTDQQYLRSPQEMQELFADIPEALANSVAIARRCNVVLELGKPYLPDYPIPDGMTMDEFFRQLSHDGLDARLEVLFDTSASDFPEVQQRYRERLDFELDTIVQMGFPGYFLIVMDFIRWAKEHDIPVGPGRGSGAGSLVAYAMEITDLDPIEYDLLFERFLNPERVSMPDFDVDFCMEKRDKVIEYVADNYGREAVSQIITFGTMAAKAVVRDVARVQGKSYGLADKLSKMIPFEVGMTLEKALEQEEPLREFLAEDDQAQEIWDMAEQLEGVTRGVGKHAGGVVIAPSKLTDFSPLYCDETGSGLVTQYDKGDVEDAGLVKFDFLGLRTLTIIDWAVKMINPARARAGEEPLDIMQIPLDDAPSFRLLMSAETTAVFQLESRGMKDLIKRLQPDCFEDIVALVALFRPGPLQSGMVDNFINRKHGREEISYPDAQYQHEWLQPILQPTYGIILYQEQVMQIAQELAGYTLGGADMLRRAMGKKKPEEMAKQRAIFEEGAQGKGVDGTLAMKIFDLVEKFAGYGFNKSHSAAYALVSYQTCWLKTHYPAPFMAAVMSSELDNTDKIVIFVEECRRMKLSLKLPDVNEGQYMFTVNEQDDIIYGLGAIKGLGEGPIENILKAREEGGPFKDLFDFCARTDPRKVNRKAIEALIRSGALDSMGETRWVLMASMEDALKAAEQSASNRDAGIDDLFGEVVPSQGSGHEDVYAPFRNMRPWPDKERLGGEKDTLGLYITGHPIDEYEREIRKFAPTRIADLRADKQGNQVLAGLIVAMRTMKTKRGDTMAILTLDDRSARLEVTVYAEAFNEARELLGKDKIVIVEGKVAHDDYSGGLAMRVSGVRDLTQARQSYASALSLQLRGEQLNDTFVAQLQRTLESGRGGSCPVSMMYLQGHNQARFTCGENWRVSPTDELLQSLRDQLGQDRVALEYR
ncbi:DNA polymerase III subunit alpha [Halioglobus japonicus]|uniref:DNA polymerase III subunit alpha n=1 Tax=Halioglobus japonicus TaxID=930805 RepID=A0AAP8SNC4_9GAMM|nr:DNA polymerase III subunit alpha [Halioglobus japonicus]AQA18309.1 DNA polymerase III subunit alpha [Halioglobus japonicus]PLW86326.1 DNA polymerase III subunit alpha [Halioglobus japonicus]GHD13428.1 DNA polymerase III subunit alpha [Halioglobus japonicus]